MRVVAIARVVLYHVTELGWLTVVFPSMGVMFAIGGSLTARSLTSVGAAAPSRASRGTTAIVVGRFRRLLPSVWVLGAVAVVAPLALGSGTGALRDNLGLLWWLLPLSAPTQLAGDDPWVLTGGLWYLTAYLWFVLLSPILLRLFQSWPRLTLGVALTLPVVLHADVLTIGGAFQAQAYDLTQYAACWLIGMAHRELWLARARGPVLWSGVGLLGLVAVSWLVATGQTPDTVDLHEIPVVNALWSAAFAAALLRLGLAERMAALMIRARSNAVLASAVRALNARALTIYLWHFPSLLLARSLTGFDRVVGPWLWPTGAIAVAGTALAAFAVGWVEDIAARRPVCMPWRIPGGPARHHEGQP